MIQPKNKTEDLFFSITKNCETLIKQTHRKLEETLEFKLIEARQTFSFKPPISIEGSWMMGLISLEIYNSIFNITEENNKFELYTDTFDEFSLEELKDELEEILNTSDNTPSHLQHEIIGRRILLAYRTLRSEKSSTDGYNKFLKAYARSLFRDFGSYLTIVAGLDEDDT